jgi:transposase
MSQPLSLDLRQRVIAAIEGGLSCRQAAERFGVSAASAIRWRSRQLEAGEIAPKRQGGDRRSRHIEAHARLILDAVAAKPDITLTELRDKLKDRGAAASVASLWRFFHRRKITLKRRRTPPSNAAAM